MRAVDLLLEDSSYAQDIEREALIILTRAKAAGLKPFSMESFLDHMVSCGFSITEELARNIIEDIPFAAVNDDKIDVSGGNMEYDDDDGTTYSDGEDSEEKVSDMAKRVTDKEMK
jgi:hypothetical protein